MNQCIFLRFMTQSAVHVIDTSRKRQIAAAELTHDHCNHRIRNLLGIGSTTQILGLDTF
jgi:hypothetical protein